MIINLSFLRSYYWPPKCCAQQLFPASDYSRGHGNQINEHRSDNKTVLDSSWKLGGATEHLIDSSEKCICQLRFEFLSWHVIEIRSSKSLLLYQDYSANL